MSHRRFPSYPDDADYTTNAPSYYEDLARKQALIKELAERIWGYEETLKLSLEEIAQRFIAWDAKIAGFDGDLNELLQEWMLDGTFEQIINEAIFEDLNDKIDKSITNLVNVELFGAKSTEEVGYENFDSTSFIQNAITQGKVIYFPHKHYKVTDELKFVHGQSILAPNGLVLDGTNFVGSPSGTNVLSVTNEGENYTSLPTLTNDLNKGDTLLMFNASHGLKQGDIVCLYDNTEYSWSSSRANYKKSEFCRVSVILSTNEVLLDSPLYDSYGVTNLNFGAYKMNMGTFNVIGDLHVIQGKLGSYNAIKLNRLKDFHINSITAQALNGSYSAINLNQCFNTNLKGTGIQQKLSGLGGDYGLAISNSQHTRAEGYFSGSRHGVTHGGSDGVGSVITRDSHIKGVVKTNQLGGVEAFDTHGNCEDIVMEGIVYGGLSIGGQGFKMKGTVYSKKNGICFYGAELKKFDFDLSNCKFVSSGDPNTMANGRGVIDFGGSQTSEANFMEGGKVKLNNMIIDSPLAEKAIVIRTRNSNILSNAQKDVDISNTHIITKSTSLVGIVTTDSTGLKPIDNLDLTGLTYNSSNLSLSNVNNILMNIKKGSSSFTTDTALNTITVSVIFPKPYPSGYKPNVTVGLQEGTAIGTRVTVGVGNITNTGFVVTISTLSELNFGTIAIRNFNWLAQ